MKICRLFGFLLFLCVFFAGCAEIEIPGVRQILKEPLGDGSVKIGMTVSQVASIYGEPNRKSTVTSSDWAGSREEWLYTARYSVLPVGAGYLSEDLYLYFDGENVTHISRKPLGTQKVEDTIK